VLAALFTFALFTDPAWAQDTTLRVDKTDSPDPVVVGQPLTYTIDVRNTGNTNPAQSVVLNDPLPPNTTFSSAEVTAGGGTRTSPAVGAGTGTITCNLGDIAPNTTETVTIVVRPTAAAGFVDNTATADGTNTAPASDTERTAVVRSGVTIEKDDSPDPADVGESLRYTLAVTNNTGIARDVDVVDRLPEGVDFISADDRCTESNNVVTCRINNLAGNGGTATIRIFVEPQEEGTIENTARAFARDDRSTPLAEATETTRVQDGTPPSPDPDPDPGNVAIEDRSQTNVCENVVNIINEDVQNPVVDNDQNANVTNTQTATGNNANEQVVEISQEQVVKIDQELNVSPVIVQQCIQQNAGRDAIMRVGDEEIIEEEFIDEEFIEKDTIDESEGAGVIEGRSPKGSSPTPAG
jgi:uncharacterized repeat protein (TIGR01451 family)